MQYQVEFSSPRFPPVVTAALGGDGDPVFRLIEAHRQAMRTSAVANEAAESLAGTDGTGEESPEWMAANIRRYEAWEAEDAALLEFLTTGPTTRAGALAALDHASSPHYPDGELAEKFAAPVLFAATSTQDVNLVGAAAHFPAMIADALRKLLPGALS
jgi:hypothetical protein